MDDLTALLESCEINVAPVSQKPKIRKNGAISDNDELNSLLKSYCEADSEAKKLEERKKKLRDQILTKIGDSDSSRTITSEDEQAAIRVDIKHKYTLSEKKLTKAEITQISCQLHPLIGSHCQLDFPLSAKDKLTELLLQSELAFLANEIDVKFELKETGAKLTKLLSESTIRTNAISDSKSYQITVLDNAAK